MRLRNFDFVFETKKGMGKDVIQAERYSDAIALLKKKHRGITWFECKSS